MYGDVVIARCITTHLIIMSKTPLLPLQRTQMANIQLAVMSHGLAGPQMTLLVSQHFSRVP